MRIQGLEIIRVAIPFDDGVAAQPTPAKETTVATGFTGSKRMESLIIRIATDTGLVGWGEAFGHSVNPSTFVALTDVVGAFFNGVEIDADMPGAVPALRAAEQYFHLFGRTGPVLYALSGIDTALWDIKAKAAGQPLFRWLGGKRNELNVYASLVSYAEQTEPVVRNALEAYEAGFRDLKLHERTFPAIAAVREALPADARLMVDFNCPWSLDEATSICQELSVLDLAWLEEPIYPPDDISSLAMLRRKGSPIGGGENVSGLMGLKHSLEAGAFDVIQPSVAKIGGISAMIEAFDMIGRYPDVTLQPHCYYVGPGLLATAHLLGLLDNAMLEVPYLRFESYLYEGYCGEPSFQIPETPGLGFEPDDTLLEKYLIQRHRVF